MNSTRLSGGYCGGEVDRLRLRHRPMVALRVAARAVEGDTAKEQLRSKTKA